MREVRKRDDLPPHTGPSEALGMVLLCFGSTIFGSLAVMSGPVRLVSFSDDAVAAVIFFQCVLGIIALAVLHVRAYPLRSLVPRPSWRGTLAGIGLCLCCALVGMLVFWLAPHPSGSPLGDMVPAAHVSWYSIVLMVLVDGSYEEIFLLAYLMRGLRRFGASTAIGITVLIRVLGHMYQGPACALAMALCGVVLGVYYHYRGRLFPVVLAHVVCYVVPYFYFYQSA